MSHENKRTQNWKKRNIQKEEKETKPLITFPLTRKDQNNYKETQLTEQEPKVLKYYYSIFEEEKSI
jgi:hypothetical protein